MVPQAGRPRERKKLLKRLSGRHFERAMLREQLYRRRFLVPNAVTLANLFCGFLSIVYSAAGRFEHAAIAIGIAILLDGLDGRVARRLNATSAFGVEFDSFSDLVSFGLAPALLVYNWAFQAGADEFGVIVCFVFALAAAGRLARFNTQPPNLKTFSGLPTPAAAGFVAAGVHALPTLIPNQLEIACFAILMLLLAYLMVSSMPFFSLKTITIVRMNARAMAAMGAVIALLWYNNKVGLFLVALTYVLSGPIMRVWRRTEKGPAATLFAEDTVAEDTVAEDTVEDAEHYAPAADQSSIAVEVSSKDSASTTGGASTKDNDKPLLQ